MEYLYIVGTVFAMASGTFCFAALQWPRLFTTARRGPTQFDPISPARWRGELTYGNAQSACPCFPGLAIVGGASLGDGATKACLGGAASSVLIRKGTRDETMRRLSGH
jgi:hypothetical protein